MRWERFQVSLSDVNSPVFAQSSLCPHAGLWLAAWSPARPLIGHWPPSPTGPSSEQERDSAVIKSLHFSSVAIREDFTPWFSSRSVRITAPLSKEQRFRNDKYWKQWVIQCGVVARFVMNVCRDVSAVFPLFISPALHYYECCEFLWNGRISVKCLKCFE